MDKIKTEPATTRKTLLNKWFTKKNIVAFCLGMIIGMIEVILKHLPA